MKKVISSKLRIVVDDEKYARSLYDALHPDNLEVPRGMSVKDYVLKLGNKYCYVVEISVEYSSKSFDSLRGALDEILTLTALVERALTMLK